MLNRECRRDIDLEERILATYRREHRWLTDTEMIMAIALCLAVAIFGAVLLFGSGCAVMGAVAVSPLHAAVRRACEDVHADKQRRILDEIAEHHRREIVARFVTLVLALLVLAGVAGAFLWRGGC